MVQNSLGNGSEMDPLRNQLYWLSLSLASLCGMLQILPVKIVHHNWLQFRLLRRYFHYTSLCLAPNDLVSMCAHYLALICIE